MNEIAPTPPAPITTPKTKRGKKPTTRAPRVIDAAIQKIHDEAKAKVAEHRKIASSARLLANIIAKQLPRLTIEDQNSLGDSLRQLQVQGTSALVIGSNPNAM